jgi:hypothetical protein
VFEKGIDPMENEISPENKDKAKARPEPAKNTFINILSICGGNTPAEKTAL